MNLKNKKVLVITTTDNMIWQFLLPHIKYMQQQGAVVECACNKTGFWFDELQQKHGLTVHEVNFTRFPFTVKNIKARKQLIKLCKQNNYDLFHCHQPVGAVMGRMMAKKFKKPCFYIAHGFHFGKDCSWKKNLIFKPVEKHYSKYTTALITMNQEDYNAAKTFKAKYVHKINGIGLDLSKYDNKTPFNRSQFRKELGLDDTDFVVLTVAEHIKRKNYPKALQTIAQVPNVKYLICGCGKLEEEHKKLAQQLNIADRTIFLGYRKDIDKIMKASDVFLFTSFQEGLPLSVEEAMVFGLPVVCSTIRGNVDLIDNNKGGFVVDLNSQNGFADAIKTLQQNQQLKTQMGEYNQNKIKDYSIDKVLKQLEPIYEEI